MAQWADFDLSEAMFTNCDETLLARAPAGVENLYSNVAGGWSRVPGLRISTRLPNQGRVVLARFREDLIAVCQSGRVFRIGQDGRAQDVTGTPVSNTRRPVFAVTDQALVIAAGGQLLKLDNDATAALSPSAPEATHAAFIDGYVVAIEAFSGRFRYSDPGQPGVWNDLSVFTAEAKPDDLVACAVTPFGELLLAGTDSIEQWETLQDGTRPFGKRWSTGEGLAYPYTLVTDTTGNYGVNRRNEFTRFQSQVTREESTSIALTLQAIDNWTDAWAASCSVKGQRFMVLQMPYASNEFYGVDGVTLLLDYRRQRWSFLWGFDTTTGRATRWPGWSIESAYGKTWVGVDDGIAEFTGDEFTNLGQTMRCLVRSGHVDTFGPSRVDDVRVRLRQGVGGYTGPVPRYGVRMLRDNTRWTQMAWRDMGAAGNNVMIDRFGGMGEANTWQMEVACTDPVPFELVKAQILVERLGW